MPTYSFPQFNVEIVDPEITINPIVKEVDPINMTISVDLVMTVPGATFGIRLEEVQVVNLNYSQTSLKTRVMERLKDFVV